MVVEIITSISWTGGLAYVAGKAIKYAGPTALDWALAYSLIKKSRQTKPPPNDDDGEAEATESFRS